MTLALELERQWAEGEAKGRADGLAQGKLEMLKELVQKGMLTIKDAAGMIGLSEELFRKQEML